MANDTSSDDDLSELNCFFLSASRHDRDRVEIQIGFDGLIPSARKEFYYEFDALLFVPKTLGLLDVEDTSSLRQEFQSYIRLHTHVSNPKSETSIYRVRERLANLKQALTFETLRLFAIELEGFLKGQTNRAKKRSGATELLPSEIASTQYLVQDFRAILKARGLEGRRADQIERSTIDHDLLLMNEYLSHVYVQYLVEVLYSIRLTPGAEDALPVIERSMSLEAQVRQSYGLLVEQRQGPQSTLDADEYPRRISLLKKYFQKALFVHVTGESLQHRLLIPVYSISAALAASWAIMIQLYQAKTMAQRVGINSIALISLGVAAYVAKDLMKDFFRRYFLTKSSYFFPDYEKKLFTNKEEKKVRIGLIKEYVRSSDSEKLPEVLKLRRYSGHGGELEESLHEDVLHFKKRVELDLSSLDAREEFPWGVREILRYRCDRLLTSMEDPYKNMHLLSAAGHPASRQAHRIYHVYLGLWIRASAAAEGEQSIKPAFRAYKVTLDKTGILDCKSVSWTDASGTIPAAP